MTSALHITPSKPLQPLLADVRGLIEQARGHVASTVNSTLTQLYWQVGKRIASELLTDGRAAYGQEILPTLSAKLVPLYGKGFSEPLHKLDFRWNWLRSFRVWGALDSATARRMTRLRVKPAMTGGCAIRCHPARSRRVQAPDGLIQRFLSFVARQKRISVGADDFYLDLLFFHRHLRRLVAVELKLEKFSPAHKGQMDLYLRWLDQNDRAEGEASPIGLILCTSADHEQVELMDLESAHIRVAQYLHALPDMALLQTQLHEVVQLARERQARLGASADAPNEASHKA